MQQIVVQRGRTIVVPVSMGFNISEDVFTSQIRTEINPESTLIAEWAVTFDTDGTDGELVLTLTDDITAAIVQSVGYMDLKRVSGGTSLPVLADPLEVYFEDVVTE